MTLLHERLANAGERLIRAGIARDEAARDAELLARHMLGWDRATMLSRRRDPAPPQLGHEYDSLIARRASREPVAYIAGHQEFWGLDFEVTPDVLIPRPETELIVEEAIAHARLSGAPRRIVDVGTGSGCLAIALAREFPSAEVMATDMSGRALEVAGRNADRHGVGDRLALVQADLFEGIETTADLIVSNPPYVPLVDAAGLQPEVREYEPIEALFAGEEGLAVLRRLFPAAVRHLADEGLLIVEFGSGQEAQVRRSAALSGWQIVAIRQDLQSIPRVAVVRR